MKYNPQKLAECLAFVEENGLMEYGGAPLKEFCLAMDIEEQTYYRWLEKSEFSEGIKEAKEKFKSSLKFKLVSSLARTATGYKDVRTEEYGEPDENGKIVTQKIKRTTIETAPNVGACIFLLTNIAGDEWKNVQRTEVTGKEGKDFFANMTDEELDERLNQLRKK